MPKNWEEAQEWLARSGGGPLTVSCPRCDRRGIVSCDGHGEHVIDWHDDARGWTWRDEAVTAQELASPEFGCGHDRRTERGFVGGSPLVRVAD